MGALMIRIRFWGTLYNSIIGSYVGPYITSIPGDRYVRVIRGSAIRQLPSDEVERISTEALSILS